MILTGLTTAQIVRTAEISEAIAIILVRGKVPPADTAKFARDRGIPLSRSRFPMFEACLRLGDLKQEPSA